MSKQVAAAVEERPLRIFAAHLGTASAHGVSEA